MGVPGYGVDQEVSLFEQEGIKYSPDHVFVFVNQVDTARDRLAGKSEPASPETFYQSRSAPFFHSARYWFETRSQLGGLLSFYWQLYRARARFTPRAPRFGPGPRLSDSDTPLDLAEPAIEARTLGLLRRLAALCQARGIRLSIVNIDANYRLSYLRRLDPRVPYHDLSLALSAEAAKYPLRFKYDRH
jgi:hypothetical protein